MELLLSMTCSFSFAALVKCKPVKLKTASCELEGLCNYNCTLSVLHTPVLPAFHLSIHPSCRPSIPPFIHLAIHQIIRPPIDDSIFDYNFLLYVAYIRDLHIQVYISVK